MNTLLRAALAGAATGSRSQSALAAFELSEPRPRRLRRLAAVVAGGGELVADKLSRTPSRLEPAGLGARVLLGAVTGSLLARREGTTRLPAALVGAVAAATTSFAGARARAVVATRLGSDLTGALAEDVVAISLAGLAVRGG